MTVGAMRGISFTAAGIGSKTMFFFVHQLKDQVKNVLSMTTVLEKQISLHVTTINTTLHIHASQYFLPLGDLFIVAKNCILL